MPNSESILRQRMRTLEAKLTRLFQNEIQRQDLIDTGLMLRTTRTYLVENPRGFSFRVESTDYFEYVDAKYDVTKNVLNSREFAILLDDINEFYAEYLANELENELKKQ